ncbi:hybrid sensor histidine kinase/response regulator transcription factor [Saccharicrinis aurantiacus]|uniref:hybrid sensor histidine kinase/response regulator transcription factor n=1 Tax=Saccharicrinis aurantiacus TaxID=1849719 RepID=UPI000B0D0782|nr:two-component regulator propeller domain-containing protein [Saccharicrinis aurantiacus]
MKKTYTQKLFAIILLFSLMCSYKAFGINFKKLTTEDGLSSSKINCIHQDKLGFIWVGTYYGLNRYDAYEFKTFLASSENRNSISNNIVLCIEEARDSNLWIGTQQGLCSYNLKKDCITRYYNKNIRVDANYYQRVNDLSFDKEGFLWLARSNRLDKFDVSSKQFLASYQLDAFNATLDNVEINCLYPDGDKIWIGSNLGLYYFNSITNEFSFVENSHHIKDVSDIYADSKSNIWIGTLNSGLYCLPNKSIDNSINYSIKSGHLSYNRVSGIEEGDDGNIYIAMASAGLYIYNVKLEEFSLYQPNIYDEKSLSTRSLSCIHKGDDGIMWLGTLKSGVNYIDNKEKRFDHYKVNFKEDGLLNNNVRALFEDRDGVIWVGTKEGGCLSSFNKKAGTFTHYKASAHTSGALNSEYISVINQLNDDLLLVGTLGGGLNILDKRTNRFRQCPILDDQSIQARCITDIYVENDKVWVATQQNLYSFDTSNYSFKRIEGYCFVTSIKKANNNKLWLGTANNGIYLYNIESGKHKQFVNRNNGPLQITSNKVNDICIDNTGNTWVATAAGLSKFNVRSQSFTFYTQKDGLPGNNVCKILVDGDNKLWLSTDNGISCYNQLKNSFKSYHKTDGLQNNDFADYVGCKTRDGELLFGGSNGFNLFHPNNIVDNTLVPKVVVNDLLLYNESVEVGAQDGILEKHISLVDKIYLNYEHNVITIGFTALNYSSSEKNQYAYKLDGFDKEWVYCKTKRYANYTNLPPGDYTFKVKASNNDGVWNEHGTSFKIEVHPPFWATWWFRFLVMLFLFTLLYIIYKQRLKLLKQQTTLLENTVRERTIKLEIANNDLESIRFELENKNRILSHKKKTLEAQRNQILEQKQTLSNQNKELILQRNELEKLNSKIESINQTKLQFFTNVSHEFRTPLTLLLVPLQKLLSLKGNVAISDYHLLFQMMRKNGNRLLHLVNRLIDFRRLEQGQLDLNLEMINVVPFFRGILNIFETIAVQQRIRLIFTCDVDELYIPIDAEKMEIVIYNLLSNSFKFTKEGGEIELSIDTHNDYLFISVKDTGIGIEADKIQYIFDRFMQIDNSESHVFHGSGIGLALTNEMVQLHKGKLTVKSELGVGSIFTIQLSALTDSKHLQKKDKAYTLSESINERVNILSNKLNSKGEEKKVVEIIDGDDQRPLVLIVDDNKDIRTLLIAELQWKYRTIQANDGEQGLLMAQKYNPDLIISDVIMPNMDGVEFCKHIKTNIETSHIPVILLTAYSSDHNHIDGLKIGADTYLEKPFNIDVLIATVANLISSRSNLKAIFTNSMSLDPKEIAVTNADEVFLSKLLEVLEAEMSNSQFSVSKLSDYMGISEGHIYKKILSLTNLNPSNFIREFRLKRAAQLLASNNLRVVEVQFMVGYESKSAFSSAFKKKYKVSPSQYANKYAKCV